MSSTHANEGFVAKIIGDGRPLLLTVAGALLFSGGFAIFLAATGDFLPHDVHYLRMTSDELCRVADCRIVDFMMHDRAAFGGALFGIGVLYTWLVIFPLTRGEGWAWWTLAITGTVGFSSFLAYLSYGYLDSWHGIGTLLLIPVFVGGMARTKTKLRGRSSRLELSWRTISDQLQAASPGRTILLIGAVGTAAGGASILWIGITEIFVAEDLSFMQLEPQQLRAISDRLVPLIAHDRAGFGGAVLTLGLTTLGCLWFNDVTRDLWEAIAIAGAVSLTAALGVHGVVGYTDLWHLIPPLVAAVSLVLGLGLAARRTAGTPTS
jgi:hypothetical protein